MNSFSRENQHGRYPYSKRMQLTCTAWVESLNTRDDGRGKTYRSCQKLESISLHDLSTGRHLLGILFISSRKSNLCRTVTTQNTTESNCVMSHAQNTNALQPNVFLSGIHRLLATNEGRSAVLPQRKRPRSTANSAVSICITVSQLRTYIRLKLWI